MAYTRKFSYQEIVNGLVSRSQAKQFIKTLPKKGGVVLDMTGISRIQQGYADELFRVWPLSNKEVSLSVINAATDVEKAISHVLGRKDLPQPKQLALA